MTRRRLLSGAAGVVTLIVIKLILVELNDHQVLAASTPWAVILLGVIIGMTYGLLAVGLVLIYRTNRIINFAHGQIGAFAAAFFGLAAVTWHFPYWVAFPVALGVGAGTGAAAEAGVVRRLRNAPRIMSVVATLGVGTLLVSLAGLINNTAAAGSLFPQPSWLPVFSVGAHGAVRVTQAYSGMLILSPLAVLGIAVFLKRSRYGLGIRAAASNPEAARMSGVFASRMSSLAWAMAGALSAFTAILTAPTQGFTTADSFGPELLLRAMTAAVVARMNSLPVAMFGGIGLGVLEQILLWNYPQSGLVEVALFVIILAVLILQPQRRGRDEEKGSWAAVQALRPLPRRALEIPALRRLRPSLLIVSLVVLILLPAVISNSLSVSVTSIIAFSIVGLSVGVLTGLGGQLSLGQFAIAAVGALVSWAVSSRAGNFPEALLYAGLTAGVLSVLIGIPALRIRGLMLTVTTLGFALATPAWLLNQSWALGAGREPGRPVVLGHPLSSGRSYYYFALVLFLVCLFLAWNVRRSGVGRLLVAVRDNEDAARAFAVRSSRVKLQGYLVAGLIAGIGGAVYGHSLASIDASSFPASFSLDVVVMTVFGGLGVLVGPILGALWVFGLPLFNLASIAVLATKLGTLLLILWRPAGLVQLVEPLRDRIVSVLAARRGIDLRGTGPDEDERVPALAVTARAAESEAATTSLNGHRDRAASGQVLLQADDLVRSFGGIRAVDHVSLVVQRGETLGLIGPNGAGKTTTFELLAGFTRPDAGHIFFDFAEISHLAPEERANRGLIRSFQDAALFPTMSVTETVMLALERRQPTRFVASTLGLDRAERRRRPRAEELIAYMGLSRYRDKQIQELSTGTRRIVELACLVALEPKCLLLDEPSSGIAQRETEALGGVLESLKTDLDLTLVVIEHDMPLIMGISDRIVVMDNGRVIAQGSPEIVAADPLVVEAYMGGSVTAIERSERRRASALSG